MATSPWHSSLGLGVDVHSRVSAHVFILIFFTNTDHLLWHVYLEKAFKYSV